MFFKLVWELMDSIYISIIHHVSFALLYQKWICLQINRECNEWNISGILIEYINFFAFKYFGIKRTWWRLFQKLIMRTKFDIYTFYLYTKDKRNGNIFCLPPLVLPNPPPLNPRIWPLNLDSLLWNWFSEAVR